MDKEQRTALKRAYAERPRHMGVLCMRCLATDERFLIASNDFKATENGLIARFSGGIHPNRHLQELWNEYGHEGFAFETVEELKCEDPSKDHTDELAALLDLCLEENPEARRVWR